MQRVFMECNRGYVLVMSAESRFVSVALFLNAAFVVIWALSQQ